MMMQVLGFGSESFDKYKASKDYFDDVKEFISDSKQVHSSLPTILK